MSSYNSNTNFSCIVEYIPAKEDGAASKEDLLSSKESIAILFCRSRDLFMGVCLNKDRRGLK